MNVVDDLRCMGAIAFTDQQTCTAAGCQPRQFFVSRRPATEGGEETCRRSGLVLSSESCAILGAFVR